MKNYFIISIVFVYIGILLRITKKRSLKSVGDILIIIGSTLALHDILSIFGLELPSKFKPNNVY